jgi:hypothetical protein
MYQTIVSVMVAIGHAGTCGRDRDNGVPIVDRRCRRSCLPGAGYGSCRGQQINFARVHQGELLKNPSRFNRSAIDASRAFAPLCVCLHLPSCIHAWAGGKPNSGV